ncbi:putative ribosome-binding factor A, mitochondrial [Bagarius yarrelli]|uniref:Putative ribosome-binding factor A, mitochondrial n=1 Tax=Bagarius yarrelli TaxID=175774 RepID=A0A556U189_BAGYA|nr:putative ribosome-binding factor A, mitochondrial [Bagarius yarrelli]
MKLETSASYENMRLTCQSVGVSHFHTAVCQRRDQLKKMFSNKRKKKWYETPQSVITAQSSSMKPVKKRSLEDSLRVRTLNSLLYKSISELLSSHEVHPQLPTYNVEITKVSLLADYSVCRIYWKTSLSSDGDSQIQQILDKCAPRIRYLLISQQILGSVPPLVFILDKQYVVLKEVENLLKIADYGPSDDSEKLILKERTDETREHTAERKRIVFGIDHDALYKQIEDYKQQPRNSSSQVSSQISSSVSLTQEQLDMLAEIRRQRLIEKKKRKAKKMKDDDITPKEFLLLGQLQKEQEQHDIDEPDSENCPAL